MLAVLRSLRISEIVEDLWPQEEEQSEKVNKVLIFTEWFLGDVYGSLAESKGLDIEFIEEGEGRFIPEQFSRKMMSFSKPFVDKLMPDMLLSPLLLFHSKIFFLRVANSVCLKLIKDEDPNLDYLKVVVFLMVVISMAFEIRCYRPLDDIPGVLYMLLKDDLKTKFYEEDRYNDILSLCEKLKKDEKWFESTVEEIQCYVKASLKTELALELYDRSYRSDICAKKISNVKKSKLSMSDSKLCPYCETECILLLKGIWKPKIDDSTSPNCLQM